MTDWDSFVEHTQESDAITGEPIPEVLAYRPPAEPDWQTAAETVAQARQAAVEAFLASQRPTTPPEVSEDATDAQEGS